MDQETHHRLVSLIRGNADDVLRDLFRRGKYPDVTLPVCVLRRMDAVLEPTKQAVLATRKMLDEARITEQRAALVDAAGQAFYNTSRFTLRDLQSRGSQQQLLADFEDYLNGFSPNVQDILENFKFRNQLSTLSKADALGTLINKFLDPDIDLSPAGVDNHSMGTNFEELVRKLNEDNNEEAGEHWTPRDAVRLMANLVFLPIADRLKSGTYLLYDNACGTGGMLTVAEETLTAIAEQRGLQSASHLYGQEINPETYAICKADMLLKGEGENADHIVGGAEWSTLSHDAFPGQEFDFMVANPPYGKSRGESNIRRWLIENDWLEAIVALPLNLFYNTGIATYVWVLSNKKAAHRAGQVQLIDASQWFKPLRKNLGKKNCELSPEDIHRITQAFLEFAPTPESRIFPNQAFGYWKVTVERPLRLHSQLSAKAIAALRFASGDEDLRAELVDKFGDALFTRFASVAAALEQHLAEWSGDHEAEDNDDEAGSTKRGLPEGRKRKLLDGKTWERDGRHVATTTALRTALGDGLFEDHNQFRSRVSDALEQARLKPSATDLKLTLKTFSWRKDSAPPVITRVHKPGKTRADPLHGLFAAEVDGKPAIVEYEPDPDLRDTEQVPLLEAGGIDAFMRREVLPYTPDAWVRQDATKIGYEISFTRHFYKPQPLRTLQEISADILAIEEEAEGLLDGLLKGGDK